VEAWLQNLAATAAQQPTEQVAQPTLSALATSAEQATEQITQAAA
jgi:hypothetical protein